MPLPIRMTAMGPACPPRLPPKCAVNWCRKAFENLHFYTSNRPGTDPRRVSRPWRDGANIAPTWRYRPPHKLALGFKNNGTLLRTQKRAEILCTPCRNTPRFTEASPKRWRLGAVEFMQKILDGTKPRAAIGATMGYMLHDISDGRAVFRGTPEST